MKRELNNRSLGIVSIIVLVIISFIFYQIASADKTTFSPQNITRLITGANSSIIFSLEEERGRDVKIYAYKTGEIIVRAYSFDLKQTIYKTKTVNEEFGLDTVLQILDLDTSNLPAPGEYGKGKDEDFCISAMAPFSYMLTMEGEKYSLLVDGCKLFDGFSEGSANQILHEFIKQINRIDISAWNDWKPNIYKVDFENFGCHGSDDFHETWPEQLQDYSFHHTNYMDSSWQQSGLFQLDRNRKKPGMPILSDVCYWIDIDGKEDYYRFDIEPLFPHEEDSIEQEYVIKPYEPG